MTISHIESRSLPIVPRSNSGNSLDQTDFLRLLTTQMKEQDPFNPTDNSQMVAQMAQFSSVSGIAEMNTSLRDIASQIAEQTRLLTEIRAATLPQTTGPVA